MALRRWLRKKAFATAVRRPHQQKPRHWRAVGARRLTVVARRAAGAAPMRRRGQNRRMNGSFRGRKKLLLEHMTKPAWMMTECFGSQRQRQRCARARKRASNAEGGHTLCFFSIFVSRAYNSKIYQPKEFPRIQKNHPLKSF